MLLSSGGFSPLRTARTGGGGGSSAGLPFPGATWSSMPRSIGIAAAPIPSTCENICPTPSAPFSTVSWPMLPNAFAASPTICGSCSAICCPITASWFSASAFARALIASASASPFALTASPSARPRAFVAAPSASPICLVRVAFASASSFTRLASAAAASSTSRAFGLRARDRGVALRLGDRAGLVGLGVGRLAHLGLELLLGALGLELRDLRLLDDDLLLRGRGGERPGLLGLGLRALRIGGRLRLLDLRLASRRDLERLGLLLALGRLAVGRRLGDPRLLRHAADSGAARFSMYPLVSSISWICSESIVRPSRCISIAESRGSPW